ncbi:fatty acyl-AMP ligase [Mycobacterium sp. SMC-4]|uniref:fatty acyl-AMP ligase n=1 Tax=Mycobacterium sp. SMC-4 TaxID=2857059 RepID=UPI0021B469A1|nr:fatty acyl-AMP ligase [Mycobacterium sp. SMC-4]UXA16042.1 AMP-binding protein [Mycobacterium sp. SMC-4]
MGLLQIEECLGPDGGIVLPPGVTLISLIDRNIAHVGDTVAYRYLDYTGSSSTRELTWYELGIRMQAIGARVQQVAERADRVAILAPQGLDYIAAFFAAIRAGTIAVPLFAPELPGHAERLDVALRDALPHAVLTTAAARDAVVDFLEAMPSFEVPPVLAVDEIPDSAAGTFTPVPIGIEDVSHLQYTGGATRAPVGVEITHRAVGTNLLQMILSIDLLDRNTHGVSWLPLYHDMGLSMIGFPTVYGGHTTLMSPTAFIRRPLRWIQALSDGSRTGRVVTAAPNFAYQWTAARGLPAPGADIDLANVSLIIGSEPISIEAIGTFTEAFTAFGLPPTAFKPSYGLAEATLFVSTIGPAEQARVLYTDREALGRGRAVPVTADDPRAIGHVSCGRIARSLWCVIVDPATGSEQPDGQVGELWLQGDNIGRGYWNRPEDTRHAFGARLRSQLPEHSHGAGARADQQWLRTGDLGFYLDGELFVTGRIADMVQAHGRQHYPHDIETTAAEASAVVRRGYVAAFTVDGDRLVVVAERATGTGRADPASAAEAIRAAVQQRHGLEVAEVRIVPAGSIPRTTSGKLARHACRSDFLGGLFD